MKSNKNSSVKTTKLQQFAENYDVLKGWKIGYIVAAVIIGIAIIIYSIFGLNLNYEFTGGTQLSVQVGNQTATEYETIQTNIDKLLDSKGISVFSQQIQGEFDTKTLIYCYQDVSGYSTEEMEALNNEIRMTINQTYNTSTYFEELGDSYDITRDTITTSSSIPGHMNIMVSASILFLMAVSLIYFCIRFSAISGLSATLSTAVSVLLTMALLVLTRIPVGINFYLILFLSLLISTYSNVIYFNEVTQNLKDPTLTDKNNHQIANITMTKLFSRNLIMVAVALIISIIVIAIPIATVSYIGLSALVAIVASVFSAVFVAPSFWVLVNRERKLSKPDVITMTQTNEKDEGAEVIEIKD